MGRDIWSFPCRRIRTWQCLEQVLTRFPLHNHFHQVEKEEHVCRPMTELFSSPWNVSTLGALRIIMFRPLPGQLHQTCREWEHVSGLLTASWDMIFWISSARSSAIIGAKYFPSTQERYCRLDRLMKDKIRVSRTSIWGRCGPCSDLFLSKSRPRTIELKPVIAPVSSSVFSLHLYIYGHRKL